jgi:hypothetical protein
MKDQMKLNCGINYEEKSGLIEIDKRAEQGGGLGGSN